jgi:hypothetical protein
VVGGGHGVAAGTAAGADSLLRGGEELSGGLELWISKPGSDRCFAREVATSEIRETKRHNRHEPAGINIVSGSLTLGNPLTKLDLGRFL